LTWNEKCTTVFRSKTARKVGIIGILETKMTASVLGEEKSQKRKNVMWFRITVLKMLLWR